MLARAIADGDRARASELLAAAPELASARLEVGASRQAAAEHFITEIGHYMYRGDTALHIAAAAYEAGLVRELVNAGAIIGAANRRGAEPLHYAVDGGPGSARWNPKSQAETVRCSGPRPCYSRAGRRAVEEAGRRTRGHNNRRSSDYCRTPLAVSSRNATGGGAGWMAVSSRAASH